MIESFLESKAKLVIRLLRKKKDQHVSPNNRLVHSFMYEVDDHQIISPDNRLIHADLGNLEETLNKPQTP